MNKSRRIQLGKIIDGLESLKMDLEWVMNEEQEAYDNLPESFQEGERGQAIEEAISNLDDAFTWLEDAISSIESAAE